MFTRISIWFEGLCVIGAKRIWKRWEKTQTLGLGGRVSQTQFAIVWTTQDWPSFLSPSILRGTVARNRKVLLQVRTPVHFQIRSRLFLVIHRFSKIT
uniref:Uncharacterized protein MANES_17G046400 n=1 Tax=Rhizophora mucronata TaxID=61149 RepID=A0A2P2LRF2_RHIMU